MSLPEILLIALGLAMDAFAVSICSGAKEITRGFRPTFRLSFHFGLFQFLMPVLGWFLGSWIQDYIVFIDHWIAFGLLAFVGVRMIKSGFAKDDVPDNLDPSKGMNLVMLSIATSIDAFAIGLSFAMLKVNIWFPGIVIGVITGILSLIGVQLGNKLGVRFGKKMELIGGAILIIIGVRILFEHLYIN
jgi:putative Mn2+ efflux pump MntP